MPIITERDVLIFKALAHGPLPVNSILYTLKIANRLELKKEVLYQRLHHLKKGKLMKSRLYPMRHKLGTEALYALTEISAGELYRRGYEEHQVRMNFPRPYAVAHELELTGTVRAIYREAHDLNFEVAVYDEDALKRISGGGGKRKAFPDLMVHLVIKRRPNNMEKKLFVEVDNDTIPVQRVLTKLAHLDRPTLMLCTVNDRITKLRQHISAHRETKAGQSAAANTFFSLQSDFIENGFVNTNFLNVEGKKAVVVPQDIVIGSRKKADV